jgi:hypothetical protein
MTLTGLLLSEPHGLPKNPFRTHPEKARIRRADGHDSTKQNPALHGREREKSIVEAAAQSRGTVTRAAGYFPKNPTQRHEDTKARRKEWVDGIESWDAIVVREKMKAGARVIRESLIVCKRKWL